VGSFFKHLIVQANDNVLALGGNYDGALALARFHADGSLDASFGNLGGFTHSSVGSFSTNPGNMVVQPDGRILVVGTAVNNNNDLLVARYNGSVVGIDEAADNSARMRVFPNPAQGSFTVSVPHGTQQLILTDALAHVVEQRTLNGSMNASFEVTTPGVYQVTTRGSGERLVKRVVVM
jgi:hypothetical protein